MGAILQNFLSEHWLLEQVKESQSTLIAQFRAGSAKEPLKWVKLTFNISHEVG